MHMRNLLRRAIAFLLAVVMLFGLAPAAFASEADESPPDVTVEPDPEVTTEPTDATAPESTEDPPPDTGPASEATEPEAESTTPPDVTDPETTEPEETEPDTTIPDETVPMERNDGWEKSVTGTYFFFSEGGKTYAALPMGSASTQEEEDLTVDSATQGPLV